MIITSAVVLRMSSCNWRHSLSTSDWSLCFPIKLSSYNIFVSFDRSSWNKKGKQCFIAGKSTSSNSYLRGGLRQMVTLLKEEQNINIDVGSIPGKSTQLSILYSLGGGSRTRSRTKIIMAAVHEYHTVWHQPVINCPNPYTGLVIIAYCGVPVWIRNKQQYILFAIIEINWVC